MMDAKKINLTIDGQSISVDEGLTVLEAAQQVGIHIPTLCYLKDLQAIGACRVCLVEVQGLRALQAACVYPVSEGMIVKTNSPAVREARKTTVELILSNHPQDCLQCVRNLNCELQKLAQDLGIRQVRFQGERNRHPKDESTPSIVRDPEKCVLCRRCVNVCAKVQGVHALGLVERGFDTVVAPACNTQLNDVACALCGQCVLVCPTAALTEKDHTRLVWDALADASKHVIVQVAPAIRVAIGETVGLKPGSLVTGKLAAALRRLGFAKVFDTDFAADLTIMEEANELLKRMNSGGKLPMITSCSPGWIKFIEHFYPEMLDHLSTCKSPQEMFGALAKTYYAEKQGIDPKDIVVVSVMPCTAKKFEVERPEMTASGYKDVDVVLTTRELGRMIQEAGINFASLADEEFDAPLGISTGAAVIFGATGGVMEAALRTAYEVVTEHELSHLDFHEVRGLDGIKEASVDLNGTVLKVAVAHSLGNARRLLDAMRAGEVDYHFIEVMACPGGCIGGGGQPIPTNREIRLERMSSIYREDQQKPLRKSHENPAVKALYEEYLGEPLGERSHHLLHTHYHPRNRYPEKK